MIKAMNNAEWANAVWDSDNDYDDLELIEFMAIGGIVSIARLPSSPKTNPSKPTVISS